MISQTVEYAFRAMVHLAGLPDAVSVNSETIARATHVPQGYLSKILRDLVVAELIVSQRGPNGGFALARRPRQISMLEIVNAVDPIERIHRCPLGNPHHLELCPLHRRLDGAIAMVEREFGRTTLATVLETNTLPTGQCGGVAQPTVRGRKV